MNAESELRNALIEHCLELVRLNMNQGTAGNLSARCGDVMLITPSAVPYKEMTPAMIARMPIATDYGAWTGPLPPSSEWRMHLDILRARRDVGAVVHTHALYATTLAVLGKAIPAVHYMIAAFGGPSIRCTDYAPFGTQELSDLAIAGLEDRHGVLLGQHGMIATGRDLREAMWRAVELETLAKLYVLALGIGRPLILSDQEVMRTVERFKFYGYKSPGSADGGEPSKAVVKTMSVPAAAQKRDAKTKDAKAKKARNK